MVKTLELDEKGQFVKLDVPKSAHAETGAQDTPISAGPEEETGETREIVAAYLGMGRTKLRHINLRSIYT